MNGHDSVRGGIYPRMFTVSQRINLVGGLTIDRQVGSKV